ncbi:MAG TPA: hypothetical protein PKC83_11180 [Gemmatimonadaceae bacterium]|nr:hypothetical protein [Gemmatimonadaceae bacterium]
MADVIRKHFGPTTPIVEPPYRDADQHEQLALIVATSTLKEEMRARFEDEIDVRVAHQIVQAIVASYREALAQWEVGR